MLELAFKLVQLVLEQFPLIVCGSRDNYSLVLIFQHLGSILFALKYDFENQNLELRIVKCVGLLAKDVGGTSDPYVKAVITPGSKKYYLETKIKMKTLNPEWRETFYFEGKNNVA